jgi:hypothetical protein
MQVKFSVLFCLVLLAKNNQNDEVKDDEMGRECSTKGNAYRLLLGKPEGERPLGRPRIR